MSRVRDEEERGLPDPISDVLVDTADEARVNRLWRGIEERQSRPKRSLAPIAIPALAAAAAVGLVVAWGASSTDSAPERPRASVAPLALEGGGSVVGVHAEASARTLRFADGSRVTLEPGASLVPLANDGEHLAFRLDAGRARFEVTPGGPRAWAIETEAALVEVVGTVFTVEIQGGGTRVEVERGVVRVTANEPARVHRLEAGDHVEVPGPETHAALEPPPSTEPAEEPPAVEAIAEPRPSAPRPVRPEPPSGPSPEAADPDTLLARADDARREGRTDEAAALLARASAGAGPSAALAAFTLGRLELDARHQPREAARAFSRALELPLPPRLAEDAAARLADAHERAGDHGAARRAADAYLRDYADGRHADRMRGLLP